MAATVGDDRGAGSSGLRSEAIRQSNLTTILHSLHYVGPASRSDLVARTGLTRSAVGALINELVECELVSEVRAASDGNPGRPSPVASVRGSHNVVVAIAVLVDSISVAAVGLGGTVLSSIRLDRQRIEQPVEEMTTQLAELVRDVTVELEPDAVVHGLGVAIAGIVRRSDNRLMFAPNIGWHDTPFGELLHDAIHLDVPVTVANDADLGALAESRRGAATGFDSVVYLLGEVGVGAGILSGSQRTGPSGFSGEVGHLPINVQGRQCNCGAVGCWETEVGEDAMLRRAGKDPSCGRAAVDELLDEAARGERVALGALAEHGRWLGIGIAGLVNMLSPDVIVLGGLLHRTYPFVIAELEAEVDHRALDALRTGVRVVQSDLGVDSSLIGAAELAWLPVLSDPAAVRRAAPTPD